MSNQDLLDEIVKEACVSLFRDYSLTLEPTEPRDPPKDDGLLYCGVLGFTGAQLRGTLLLATTKGPLGRTNPIGDGSLRNWIEELSNQLLGRVKNQLLRRGVTIHASIPVFLCGQHLAPLPHDGLAPLAFRCEGGLVCVWFDSELAAGVEISEALVAHEAVSEGTSILF